jgi:hypothetical protein
MLTSFCVCMNAFFFYVSLSGLLWSVVCEQAPIHDQQQQLLLATCAAQINNKCEIVVSDSEKTLLPDNASLVLKRNLSKSCIRPSATLPFVQINSRQARQQFTQNPLLPAQILPACSCLLSPMLFAL